MLFPEGQYSLSQQPDTSSPIYQLLFSNGRRSLVETPIGFGAESTVFKVQGADLAAKVCSVVPKQSYLYDPKKESSSPVNVSFRSGSVYTDGILRMIDERTATNLANLLIERAMSQEVRLGKTEGNKEVHVHAHQEDYFIIQDRRLYMVLVGEFIPGDILGVREYTEAETALVVREVADCLKFLERRGIVYADLKPDNLLGVYGGSTELSETHLVDLGFSVYTDANRATDELARELFKRKQEHRTRTRKLYGTKAFMSPEQARIEDVGPKSPLYSLGLTVVKLLTNQGANDGKNARERVANSPREVQREAVESLKGKGCSPDIIEGVRALLNPHPEDRRLEPILQASKFILARDDHQKPTQSPITITKTSPSQ